MPLAIQLSMQVACTGTSCGEEVRQRYGAEVLSWLEADQSAHEHAGRPQPTLEVADAGSDAHGPAGVRMHPRPSAAAQPADLPARTPAGISPLGLGTPAARSAESAVHGSNSAAAAPPPPLTAPQTSAPASGRSATGRPQQAATAEAAAGPPPTPPPAARSHWRFFAAGAVMAVILHTALHWAMQLPLVRRLISRFIWMKPSFPWATSSQSGGWRLRLLQIQSQPQEHQVPFGMVKCAMNGVVLSRVQVTPALSVSTQVRGLSRAQS